MKASHFNGMDWFRSIYNVLFLEAYLEKIWCAWSYFHASSTRTKSRSSQWQLKLKRYFTYWKISTYNIYSKWKEPLARDDKKWEDKKITTLISQVYKSFIRFNLEIRMNLQVSVAGPCHLELVGVTLRSDSLDDDICSWIWTYSPQISCKNCTAVDQVVLGIHQLLFAVAEVHRHCFQLQCWLRHMTEVDADFFLEGIEEPRQVRKGYQILSLISHKSIQLNTKNLNNQLF
jgi:hypothetical protein